jgi:serine protease Do
MERIDMSVTTNSLVAKAKRLGGPAAAAAVVLLGFGFLIGHTARAAANLAAAPNGVAALSGGAPMDDNSVSALVNLDNAVEAVAARVTPAVVNVAVTSRVSAQDEESDNENGDGNGQGGGNIPQNAIPPEFRRFFFGGRGGGQQQPQLEHGIGSGIIISPDGYIVTNDHVVNGATQIRVTLNDRRVFPAKLVGVDKLDDLAVIKINANNLTTVAWGDSTKLRPGQTVLAFGSPFGYFQFSVTRGIVSAVDRPNPYSDDPRKPGAYIQTDAAINPGNSGGPLVDAHGELVGINTFIITNNGSFAGAGFAIPSHIVRASAESIIKDGTVHHGYLGISMNDVTPDNSSFFNLPDATGAIVSQVTPDSPASQAGLKSGDVLRELNGTRIKNGSQLQVAVSQTSPGTDIKLGILREGKPETMTLKVGEFKGDKQAAENSEGGSHQRGKLGLAVDNLTQDARQQFNIPTSVQGTVVASVRPASPAEDAGLAPGDVIEEVNRKAVKNAQEFADDMQAVPAGKDILLLVWSHGGASYRVVHPAQSNQNGQ